MEKLLSKKFYTNLNDLLTTRVENESNKLTLQKVDWEKEAENCFIYLTLFLGQVNIEKLKKNNIDKIGVIDICWNEYGSDIEVDFMPDNNFENAFANGCLMNDSAIDNDNFFKTYFDVNGENAWEQIGDDYHQIILIFYYIIEDIIAAVARQEEFKNLPKKSPCHIGFASFHDEERTKIFSIK
ncbi:hypothetical protein [uncultured Nonlabens sp.]|uniref:hypothetical protein n=1 Tax=uncultured Nonlabens sp. TaxID=859306 RepID=UPI00263264C1|nr:hypothetical protein [uncultured Nonlabens sp.]